MSFRKWLEDTGEVRTATLTNGPPGIPSKYVCKEKEREKRKFRNPFKQKVN